MSPFYIYKIQNFQHRLTHLNVHNKSTKYIFLRFIEQILIRTRTKKRGYRYPRNQMI